MYTILILDDEEKHLSAVHDYLNLQGFTTYLTSSPLLAFPLIKKLNPDLLILDIMMPYMRGYKFITKLRTSSEMLKIPFIFLSAKGMTQDRIKAYKLGCSGYISKPFDPEELIAIINNVLGKEKQREKDIIKTIKQIKRLRLYLEHNYYIYDLESVNLILTRQENIVLNYLIKGFKNREIAAKLDTSVRTVEKYVTKLLQKTNTKNRTDLVRFIYLNKFSLSSYD